MLFSYDLDEIELVHKTCAGDFGAVESLYEKYSRLAFGLALHMLQDPQAAQESVHDAFVCFWRNPSSYNPAEERFVLWLLRLTRNICRDYRQQIPPKTISPLHPSQNSEPSTEQALLVEGEWLSHQRTIIRQALTNLPTQQRLIIEAAFFRGLTQREIANEIGLSTDAVKNYSRTALWQLKETLA